MRMQFVFSFLVVILSSSVFADHGAGGAHHHHEHAHERNDDTTDPPIPTTPHAEHRSGDTGYETSNGGYPAVERGYPAPTDNSGYAAAVQRTQPEQILLLPRVVENASAVPEVRNEAPAAGYVGPARDAGYAAPAPVTQYEAPVVRYEAPAPVVRYEAPAPVTQYEAPVVRYEAPVVRYEAPAPVVRYEAPTPVTQYEAPVVRYEAPTPVAQYAAPVPEYNAPTGQYSAPILRSTFNVNQKTDFSNLRSSETYHQQGPKNTYAFGYVTDQLVHEQNRAEDGIVRGHYGYVDSNGQVQQAQYVAHPSHGFHVAATNLPVAPSSPHRPQYATANNYQPNYPFVLLRESSAVQNSPVTGEFAQPTAQPTVQPAHRPAHVEVSQPETQPQPAEPIVLDSRGVPLEPTDVLVARAEHFAAHNSVLARGNGPVVPLETPEVIQAKQEHFAAVAQARSSWKRSTEDIDDDSSEEHEEFGKKDDGSDENESELYARKKRSPTHSHGFAVGSGCGVGWGRRRRSADPTFGVSHGFGSPCYSQYPYFRRKRSADHMVVGKSHHQPHHVHRPHFVHHRGKRSPTPTHIVFNTGFGVPVRNYAYGYGYPYGGYTYTRHYITRPAYYHSYYPYFKR